jgi:hypothetical protein
MPRLIDHHANRALVYRNRAIELAMQAKREDDPGQLAIPDRPRQKHGQCRRRARTIAARRAGNFPQIDPRLLSHQLSFRPAEVS